MRRSVAHDCHHTDRFAAEFAADVRRDLALDAEAAAVEVSLRRARLEPVRGDLPAAVVPDHARREPAAVDATPTRSSAALSRRRAARSSSSDAAAARSWCCSPRRCRRAAASARVHLIDISSQALEQTEQRLGRLQHFSVVGHQSHLRGRAAPRGRAATGQRSDARPAARIEHRQFRYAGGRRRSSQRIRARAGPGRPAAARRRSREERSATCCSPTTIRSASPRRSTATCSSASTASSVATSISPLSPPRGMEPRAAAHRDASRQLQRPGRSPSRSPTRPFASVAASGSGPRALTSTTPDQIVDMGAGRQPGRRAISGWTTTRRFALTMFVAASGESDPLPGLAPPSRRAKTAGSRTLKVLLRPAACKPCWLLPSKPRRAAREGQARVRIRDRVSHCPLTGRASSRRGGGPRQQPVTACARTPAPNADGSTAEAIRIDGELTEAAWQRAPVVTGFLQRDPNDGAPATYQTEARVAYDATSLYIAVTALDPGAGEDRRPPHPPRRAIAVGLDPRDGRFVPRQAERVRVRRQSRPASSRTRTGSTTATPTTGGTRCGTWRSRATAGRLARRVPDSVFAAPLPPDRERDVRAGRSCGRSGASTRPRPGRCSRRTPPATSRRSAS